MIKKICNNLRRIELYCIESFDLIDKEKLSVLILGQDLSKLTTRVMQQRGTTAIPKVQLRMLSYRFHRSHLIGHSITNQGLSAVQSPS